MSFVEKVCYALLLSLFKMATAECCLELVTGSSLNPLRKTFY